MIEKVVRSLSTKTPQERLTMRKNAEVWANGDDPKKAEQGLTFLEALNRFEQQTIDEERDRLMNLPLVARIEEAFLREPPSETEVKMILVLADPSVNNTTGSLSYSMGWEEGLFGGGAWNLHFGRMCSRREAFLQPAPPRSEFRGDKYYSKLLASIEEDGDQIRYELRTEAIEAFIKLGLLPLKARSVAMDRNERMKHEVQERAARVRQVMASVHQQREEGPEA